MLQALRPLLALALALCSATALSAITVEDDSGETVTLAAPAQHIVSLAPHITELLYAAGAGERIVGVGSYSDYPPAARTLPQVGSHTGIDLERLLALKPDLVIAWQSGNGVRLIERLRGLGLTVFVSEPSRLEDVPRTLEQLGRLADSSAAAQAAAAAFRERQQRLAERYSQRPPLPVFYQIWHQPLMTVNGEHLISEVIRLCGGRNIFSDLRSLAPTVDVESVLAARPQVIIVSGADAGRPAVMDDWRRWPRLPAVAENQLYFIPPDIIQRHSPRILEGARVLCEQLEQARS